MSYIKHIEIESLWNGQRHVAWDLQPDVNILSGANGMGKSTILQRVVKHLLTLDPDKRSEDGVTLTFEPEEATGVDFDVIRSFDRPVLSSDFLNKMTDLQLHTELDFTLYQLQRSYLDYQVNLSNRMLELFTAGTPDAHEKAQEIAMEKTHFLDVLDDLFKETGKSVVRTRNEIYFNSLSQ